MAHKVIEPPTQEPISLVELRAHLRLDAYGEPPEHPEDTLIQVYLSAARESAEMFLNFALAPQIWEMALDAFPADAVELEGGSVGEILSIKYVDDATGMDTTVDPSHYMVDTYSTPNWLLPSHDGPGWPSTLRVANAVRIRYRVGVDPLPPSIRAALLLTVGHLYVNREQNVQVEVRELKMGVQQLLWPFRRGLGV